MKTLDPEIEELIRRVRETGLTQPEIAERADVNRWWLNHFMQGRFKSPGYDKIRNLTEFVNSQGQTTPTREVP